MKLDLPKEWFEHNLPYDSEESNMQKIRYIEGDMFGVVKGDIHPSPIIIAHCCNDRGAWGAGFVLPLGKNFPIARESYFNWFNGLTGETEKFGLGQTQFVNVDDKIFVANMVAQTLGGSRPLYYNHLSRCLDAVANFAIERNDAREYKTRLVCPMFGSNLAGGDWNIIEKLIEDAWLKRDLPVDIYYLSGTLPSNWTLPKEYSES